MNGICTLKVWIQRQTNCLALIKHYSKHLRTIHYLSVIFLIFQLLVSSVYGGAWCFPPLANCASSILKLTDNCGMISFSSNNMNCWCHYFKTRKKRRRLLWIGLVSRQSILSSRETTEVEGTDEKNCLYRCNEVIVSFRSGFGCVSAGAGWYAYWDSLTLFSCAPFQIVAR